MSLALVASRVLLRIDDNFSIYPLINPLFIFSKCSVPSFFSKESSLSFSPGSNKNYSNSILILFKIDFHVAPRLSDRRFPGEIKRPLLKCPVADYKKQGFGIELFSSPTKRFDRKRRLRITIGNKHDISCKRSPVGFFHLSIASS